MHDKSDDGDTGEVGWWHAVSWTTSLSTQDS